MDKKKGILLTGGTGFIGSHLTKKLLTQGYSLYLLKRPHSSLHRLQPIEKQLHFVEIDELNHLKDRVHYLLHLAALTPQKQANPWDYLETNVNLSLKLLHWAVENKLQLFLNLDTVVSKTSHFYGFSKAIFKEAAPLLLKESSLKWINLQIDLIYGFDKESHAFPMMVLDKLLKNEEKLLLTQGVQRREFLYIDDLVEAIVCLLMHHETLPHSNTFELGTADPPSVKTFVETLKKMTQAKTELLFGAIPYQKEEIMHFQADISPLQQLGWNPKHTLEEGLTKTLSRLMI